MKRKIAALSIMAILSGLLAAIPFSVSAESETVSASGINIIRGEGFLVIYTPEHGASTGTNVYGVEAVVDADHRVVEVGKNNCAIPEGGFVLSGHDADDGSVLMKTWINKNVHVGDYVYYNKNSLIVTVSDEPLDISENGFYVLRGTYTCKNKPRFEDYLVVYDSSFGTTTSTNEYGYEVIVQNGRVTSIGGNNSAIPKNGFVLSGHGTMMNWLINSVRLGMSVVLDTSGNGFTLVYDADSIVFSIENELTALPKELEAAKKSYLYMDYDGFDELYNQTVLSFNAARTAYENGGSDSDFIDAGDAILETINHLRRSISESRTVEYRAVWLRPSQKNAAEVEEYVKRLYDAGINTICVEGIFDNTVIFNVPDGCLFEHNRSFSYDVLQAYIDACHKYGMECHLWMAIYLVGESNQSSYRRSVGYKKPEWLSADQNGNTKTPIGFAMIDPANEEAREYLLSFYTYILQTYDIDCFQLDYIRYYDRNGENDYGYTEAAFAAFREKYGYSVNPTYNTSASYWNDWVQFRKDCVTSLVTGIRSIIDTYRPDVLLSADVIPSLSGAGVNNYQNYPEWLKNNLLDILHPMAYVDGYGDDIKAQVKLGGDRCMVVTGLGVFKDELNADDMARQAIDDNTYGAYGEAYFEAATYLKDKADAALLATVYRNSAITPFLDRDAAIKSALEYMSGRIDDILVPLGGVTADEAALLKKCISEAMASVDNARIAPEEWSALSAAVNAVGKAAAKKVISQDLLRAERITCTTYKVGAEKLGDSLVRPVGEDFPEYKDPNASDEPSEPSPDEPSGEEPSADDTPSEAVSSENGGNEQASFPTALIIGAAVVAAAAVAVAVTLKKRKK